MLRAIAEGVWAYERDLALFPGVTLPTRATLLRRSDGGLVVHSPLRFDADTVAEIEALGDVRAIVAPSRLHWMFVADAVRRWPHANVLAAPGLEEKLRVSFDPLPRVGEAIWLGTDVLVRRIEGAPYMNEHVFYHRPSRSLLVTDLVFNVTRCSLVMQLALRVSGAYRKTAQSLEWRLMTKDRALAAASVRDVLAWDVGRVIVGHGDVVEDDAHAAIRAALARMAG